jgi:hypothetical protein
VHAALREASCTFRERVDTEFKRLVVADMANYADQVIAAFVVAFPEHAPWSKSNLQKASERRRQPEIQRRLEQHFSIRVGGHEIVFKAHVTYNNWRKEWHTQGERYSTTDEQKGRLRNGLKKYWREPWEQPKPSPGARMSAQITAFLAAFAARKPRTKEPFEYRMPNPRAWLGHDGDTIDAAKWLQNVRQCWHDDPNKPCESHQTLTTEEQKQRLRDGCKEWWVEPPSTKPIAKLTGGVSGVSAETLRGAAIAAVVALDLQDWPLQSDKRTFEFSVGGVTRQVLLGDWIARTIAKWDTLTEAQQRLLESQPFWSKRRVSRKIPLVSADALRDAAIAAVVALDLQDWPCQSDKRTFEFSVGGVTRQVLLGSWMKNLIVRWDTLTDAQQRLLESQPFWSKRRPPGGTGRKGVKRARSGAPVAAASSTSGGAPTRPPSCGIDNSDCED